MLKRTTENMSRYRIRKDEVVKSRVAEFVEMEGRAAGGREAGQRIIG